MVNSFTYYQSTKIVFGAGEILNISSLLDESKKKLLIVTDQNIRALPFFEGTIAALEGKGFECEVFDTVEPNPSIQTCDKAAAIARKGCGAVIAIGGGSVIDVGKSAAMLATNEGSIKEYLLGYPIPAKDISVKPITLIAVPTTSGTGSEVSRTIVITDLENHTKPMRFSTDFYPTCAVVDPELTLKLPASVTAVTGMDVLCHTMETYLSSVNNAYTGILALEAIKKVFVNLPKCIHEPDLDCRSEMALASTIGGLCLDGGPCQIPHATAGMFAVRYNLPHGLSCAKFLPAQIDYIKVEAAEKFKKIMNYTFPEIECSLEDAGDKLKEKVLELMNDIGMDPYIHAPLPEEEFIDKAVAVAMINNGIKVCPRKVKPEDLKNIIISVFKED